MTLYYAEISRKSVAKLDFHIFLRQNYLISKKLGQQSARAILLVTAITLLSRPTYEDFLTLAIQIGQ
jgi:hypothetical protein